MPLRCATCGKHVSFKNVYLPVGSAGAVCPSGHANELTLFTKAIALVVALAMFFLSDLLLKPVLPGHWRFIPNAVALVVSHVFVSWRFGKLRFKDTDSAGGE